MITEGDVTSLILALSDSGNSSATLANYYTKTEVDSLVTGALINEGGYNASTNSPNISTYTLTDSRSALFIVTTAGTQIFAGTSYDLTVGDWVIKTSLGNYIVLDNDKIGAVWGKISGNITDQSDLITYIKTYADTKIPKVTSPTANDIAIMNADGTISDGGITKSSLITGGGTSGQFAQFNGTNTLTSVAKNTAFNQNFETVSTNIKMDGTASVGTSSNIVRADHIHPSDTTKVDKPTTTVLGDIATFSNTTGSIQDSGISSSSIVTLTGTQTLTNKTLTTPKTDKILDTNGNTEILLTPTTSAVNYVNVTNNVTGSNPSIGATGTDVNISLNLTSKGTGTVKANGVDVVTTTGTQTLTNKSLVDASTSIIDDTDSTKIAKFEASGITSGTTRNYKFPDYSGTLGLDLIGSKVILPNQVTNVILNATTTVDIGEYLICNQTTSGITIILPNPTTTTNIRRLIFVNTGSVSVIVNSTTIGMGSYQTFVWNGSSWSSKESAIKDNLTATTDPAPQADSSVGYSVGSTWINTSASITWTCIDATKGGAKWISSANTIYFDNWSVLVTDLTNSTISHAGKYIVLNNANGGNVSGTTYKSTDPLTTTITDGGSATYYIDDDYYSTSSAFFTVTCQNRNASSSQLAITGVYTSSTTATSLVSSFGSTSTFYAIWTSVASADSGIITANAIMKCSNNSWSVYQSFNNAPEIVMVGSNGNWNPWCKTGSTWVNYGINTTTLSQASLYYQGTMSTSNFSLSSAVWTQLTGMIIGSYQNATVTNSSITVANAGKYNIRAQLQIDTTGSANQTIAVYVNGVATYYGGFDFQDGDSANPTLDVTVQLNANDVLKLYAYSAGAGSVQSGYLQVEQLPIATYVPANALTPTTLNWLKLGGSASYTTVASSAIILPQTAKQGNDLTYNSSTGVVSVGKTSNYKITYKTGSLAVTNPGVIYLQTSTDGGTTWTIVYQIYPEAPSMANTYYSPQEIHWEGNLASGTYVRFYSVSAVTQGASADIVTFPSAYIEEIPSATVLPASYATVQEWTSYTPTITATTNPTYSSTYTMKGLYKQVGKTLNIEFVYYGGANAGSAGSGTYLFSIPAGYTINTALTGTTTTGADGLPVGNGFAFQNSANTGILSVVVYDSTHLVLLDHSANQLISSSRYALNVGAERIAFTADVPII